MPLPEFDTRSYWEQRLSDDYSLTGVGYRRLGPSFNCWAYRVRRARFDDAVRRLDLDLPSLRVLDVGSGTGFYVDRWLSSGAQVTGLDVTEAAMARLRQEFPTASFERADIADPAVVEKLGAGTVDVVSAMDVLFHIVDDAAFASALTNVAALLRPGGHLLYSDAFVHGRERRVAHRVSRPLAAVLGALDAAGLEPVERRPFLYLMNDPVDSRNGLFRALWYAMAATVGVSDTWGNVVGKRLYPLELRLTERRSESPSTELMVCRRR